MKRIGIIISVLFILGKGGYAQQQARRHATGLNFLDQAAYQAIPLAAPLFAGALPSQVNLVPFPEVGDQGAQGSCVAWAIAYALKTYQEEVERHWGITSNDHIFSPAFIYNQVKLQGNCNGGSYYAEALNLLTRDGVAPISAFPYDPSHCDLLPNQPVKQLAALYRIASWRRVNTLDETEVKTHLAAGFPILIGMPVDESFMNIAGPSIYQGLSGPALGGHAMVVIGYDDAKGSFRLLNSWGKSWGDSGLAWVSYPAFRQTVREGYVTQDIVAMSPIAPSSKPVIELETIVYAETPLGAKSVTKTTGDHHCDRNCEGEPTRTNYSLELAAGSDSLLKSPSLKCSAGPCQGWNTVHFARLEEGGKKAVASWVMSGLIQQLGNSGLMSTGSQKLADL